MPVERTGSVLSCSSLDSSSIGSVDSVEDVLTTPKSNKPAGEVPFARRRLQHEQTVVLSAIFEHQTHPSKDVRTALAAELGIELKTVSAWFQNRRRSVKKKSLVWTRPPQENRYEGSAYPAHSGKRHLSRTGSAISLDCVVSSRERKSTPEPEVASPVRPPLTPRRVNALRRYASPNCLPPPTNLWEHIPSSPPAPPSSPGVDGMRLSALPRRTKSLRSLEWACAKARGNKTPHPDVLDEEDYDVPMLILDGEPRGADGDGEETETEEYEAITPDVSAVQLQSPPASLLNKRDDDVAPAQDMEAAMALLGFMGRPLL